MPPGKISRFFLHLRYVLGQIAAGFLVSVPAQLILRGKDWYLVHSLAYGAVFLLAYFILLPLSRFEWREVRVPEFWRFELTVGFYATLSAGILLGASLIAPPLKANQQVFWFVLVITFFAWAQKKAHSLLFHAKAGRGVQLVDPHASTVLDGDTKIRPR